MHIKNNISPAVISGLLLFFSLTLLTGEAAEYPSRPITAISPFAPGGLYDIVGRPFTIFAEKYLGQPIVMVYKPGATSMLGGSLAAEAPADGYTLFFGGSVTHLALEWEATEGRKPPFALQNFIPLGAFCLTPPVVIVPYESPWKSLGDLIKDCKARPGFYAFCSGGLYGNTHVPVELLMLATGMKARHVPFAGGGPCLSSLVGKHIDFSSQFPGTSIPLVRGKKLRALAVQGNKRLKELPEVPTVRELGIDAEFYNWASLLVRRGTSSEIVIKLKEVFKKVVAEKEYISAVEAQGQEIDYMTGEELEKYWATEVEKIKKIFSLLKQK